MNPNRSLFARFAFITMWIFIFALSCEKSLELPGIGSLGRVTGALAMGAGLVAILAEGRFRIPSPAHIALMLVVLWSSLTYRWTVSTAATEERITTYVQLLFIVVLIWQLCLEVTDAKLLMAAYVLGTLVPALDTFRRYLTAQETFYQRYATVGFDPNDLALTLAISIPMSLYLAANSGPLLTWCCRLQLLAVVATILLTASRSGTVAMTVAFSFALVLWHGAPRKQKMLSAAAAGVMACIMIAAVPASSWLRIATLGSEVKEGTLNSRTVLWGAGVRALGDVPLQGVGAGAYPDAIASVVGRPQTWTPVAHNTFLSLLVETGFIGFSLFLAFFGMLLWTAFRMQGQSRWMWLACLLAWTIGVSALTWENRKPTWMIFGLLLAHSAARAPALASPGKRQALPMTPVWRMS
ncbi:O-antigen ligase family protein [Paludibaculum fermentans]|uniref:O-antigen ligase family protein n=1 Tax=Paludibaculum fermentans TaxID=1473598 RepID=A0A7S7NX88_PALFE|nr:O-antigen ligase family protein [Paludibaculum fermentans]QOY90869.1 O-antigen ligase family protein [Paludibaculum fermentans]